MSASKSQSKSSSVTSNQTSNIADSYNNTFNRVSNWENVGNVSLQMGEFTDGPPPSAATLLPLGIGAFVILAGILFLKK